MDLDLNVKRETHLMADSCTTDGVRERHSTLPAKN